MSFHVSVARDGQTVSGTLLQGEGATPTLDDYERILTAPNVTGLSLRFTDGRLVWAPINSIITVKEVR